MSTRTRAARALSIALLLSVLAPHAALAAEDVEKAKTLFNAGAKAYTNGRYVVAIESFREAYAAAPRPAILFSLAQAYRRQFAVDGDVDKLEQAIKNYRLYLEQVKEGGRRVDATTALGELEVIAASRLPTERAEPGETKAPEPPSRKTKITITTPTPGARISLDGGKPVEPPLSEAVKPGKHRYEITADGYIPDARDFEITEGEQRAVERELRERPALLDIEGPSDATVAIDGKLVGATPLPTQELEPGTRFIAVTRNGFRPFSRELTLDRGERERIRLDFSRTPQRITSYFFLGIGGLTILGGLGSALQAASKEGQAQQLFNKGLTDKTLPEYNAALDARDVAKTSAGVTLGVGAALGALGFVLYAFDQPSLPLPPVRKETKPSPSDKPSIDIAAVPSVGPTFAGAVVLGHF